VTAFEWPERLWSDLPDHNPRDCLNCILRDQQESRDAERRRLTNPGIPVGLIGHGPRP